MRLVSVTLILIAVLAGAMAQPALANDSTAELGAGGLVYVTTDDVAMTSEDLFISMDEVRVRYQFENKSDKDVTTLVAFPMPDIKGDIDFMDSIPVDDPANFLGFKTTVDGAPVTAKLQQRVSALGVDQTALIQSLGVPLAPQLEATRAALDKLPREQWDRLINLGLAAVDTFDAGKGWESHLAPMWVLSTAYYWEQTFPAKRTITVEHSYKPSVGSTAGVSFSTPESRKEPWFQDYVRKYCIEKSFLAAADKAAAGRAENDFLMEHRIEYILRTGANWAGPISKFHLVVDKGSPKNLVSFCGDGVKKTGPTTFEMTKEDFYPEGDFDVLILAGAGLEK
ncbi:DUF4424 domain-containing protein [Kaistia dalseonensis]|uniref:DUF4424 domain-containing protein n=1 Tax=Kaistia dalseonensis TaxID=410840 RepID=A0ABU0HBP1_9HYPH|nr:DUF4424 domain-containing protein [Kaistia dalseonensis]MCX5497103.1 DUF4424 domain-containing protein [Kaistia dalseonensis]MDQ0439729.1 hypothetical protein [Kaistia dalseonensis]